MELKQYPKNRIATLRPSKWVAGAAAMLLSASLLAGCGGGGADTTPADATSTPVVDVAVPATPEVSDSEEMTDTEEMTGSEEITDTDTTTN